MTIKEKKKAARSEEKTAVNAAPAHQMWGREMCGITSIISATNASGLQHVTKKSERWHKEIIEAEYRKKAKFKKRENNDVKLEPNGGASIAAVKLVWSH